MMERETVLYLTVPYSSKGYGFEMDGSQSPIRISWVSNGSPAQLTGLLKDDLLLTVNGHDVSTAVTTTVQAIISYSTGSPLTLKIARTNTDSKISLSSEGTTGGGGGNDLCLYQSALGDAMKSAQDALSLLGMREETEICVNLEQDDKSDDTATPAASSSNEEEDEEDDPLLDFTRGTDQYTHDTSSVHVSAAMIGGSIRTQNALQGLSNILKPITTTMPPTATGGGQPLVATEASIVIKEKTAPPIPPYNPAIPDQFPLSNRPEYQLQRKKMQHSYEDVEFEQSQQPTGDVPVVVLRNKSNNNTVQQQGGGPLAPPTDKSTLSYSSVILSGTLDPIKASNGLPSSVHTWKLVHVSSWLEQLSIQLYELYGTCFTKHSVTGHTLLHLNQTKLQYIGISNKEHRMQLAMAVARLRLHHEQKELERLSGQVSWL